MGGRSGTPGYMPTGGSPPSGWMGEADLSQAIRHRDQLPADEPGPDPDDDQEVQRAVPHVVIGLLLRNLWVWLHHVVLSSRGGAVGGTTGSCSGWSGC